MTKDEQDRYRRESAALIAAAILTNHTPQPPPPDVGPDATLDEANAAALARHEYEHALAMRRALIAEHAFMQAAALCAETELWEGPQDEFGNPLDPRAFDPECLHGKKQSEQCALCELDAAAKKPAEGEGSEAEGKTAI